MFSLAGSSIYNLTPSSRSPNISNVVLAGPIPSEIGRMSSLTSLDVPYNRLTGESDPPVNT